MTAPLSVSVIIPCYNAAPYLAEALHSVLAQDPAPVEVIVVDDGSADHSAAIAEDFRGVTLVRQPQAGIAAARNRGLDHARGDVIAFLDADDIWPAGSLSARLLPLRHQPALESTWGVTRQFVSPELPEPTRAALASQLGEIRARVAGAMLVRREAFDRVGRFDTSLRIGETIDWVARADSAHVVGAAIDDVVLLRRIHTANTTTRMKAEQRDYLRILKASLDRKRAAVTPGSNPAGE